MSFLNKLFGRKKECIFSIVIGSIVSIFIVATPMKGSTSGTWTLRLPPDAPIERLLQAMAYDSARNVTVMFGGLSHGSGSFNDTWELSGNTWIQRTPVHAPSSRYFHAMAYEAARQQVVLFGGDSSGETWIWDGSDWTLKTPTTNPPARNQTSLVYDRARGVVVMFGGASGVLGNLGDTWEWDGTNWTEKHPANTPGYGVGFSMAYDAARSRIVLFGGFGNPDSRTWEYDGNDWISSNPVIAPPPGLQVAMAYDETIQKIVLITREPFAANTINRVWEWDGTIWTERTPATGPEHRSDTTMVYDSVRAKIVLFGGISNLVDNAKVFKDTWERDGISGTWLQTISPRNPPASAAPIAYDDARREIVRFGGNTSTGGSAINETWILGDNDTSWTRRFPQHIPPTRLDHLLVYDSGRSVVVLFGGRRYNSNTFLNDTWEWDGTDWIQKQPSVSPPPRSGASITYDSGRGVAVMFGGGNGIIPFGDTWEFDGTDWVQKFPQHSPSPRSGKLVYDSQRHKTVLFGDHGTNSNETWEWDGIDWTLRSLPQSPPGRGQHAMAYDASRGITVLHGGTGPGYLSDTWEYDGNTWTSISSPVSPGPRYSSMVYNPNRRAVVLFGGGIPTGLIDDTWEYQGPAPINTSPEVSPDHASVVTDEGQAATNSGTVNDPDGDLVMLNASVGTIANNNNGTWSWSFTTGDGPAESQTVTIFADDGNGGTAQATFDLGVNNVAPTATFANTSGTIIQGESATLVFSDQSDPSAVDTAAGFLYSYDCTDDGTFEASDIAATSFDCLYPTSGDFTARGLIKDKDGGFNPYTAPVTAESNPVPFDIYLHGTGPNNNPPTLFLDNIAPGAADAKFKDSSGINFNNGNPWKDIGAWVANPTLSVGNLTTLNDLHVWLGLKNSDDQGTKFDLRAEIYKNGTLVAAGETYCITDLTRNAAQAKEATVSFGSFSSVPFNSTSDALSLKIQTRIGTDGSGSFCGGHSNAVGLRLYFDASSRPSRFNVVFGQ